MRILLTDETVCQLLAKSGQHTTQYTDSELPGFGIRVSRGGGKSWTVQYKVYSRADAGGGYARRTCLGYWPQVTASEARRLAEGVRELGLRENLHPTEALRRLTGNGSRGVVGMRPCIKPALKKWEMMHVSLDKVVQYAYMLTLEARYGSLKA